MLNNLFYPERYHGHGRRPPFFEGWYFKLVDPTEAHKFAVIPGIFKHADPARHHAFIQILDGSTGHATYHRFPAEAFKAAQNSFHVDLENNVLPKLALLQQFGFYPDPNEDLADDDKESCGAHSPKVQPQELATRIDR